MACTLGTLVDNLDKDSCKNLRKFYKGEKFELLKRKGVYPYDYMDSPEKLSDKQLPSKEEFCLRLNKVSDEDYHQHAQNVWDVFNMKTMREYHDLYLKSDVLLLADVFENFRNVYESIWIRSLLVLYISRSFLGRVTEDHKYLFGEY